MDGAVIEGIYTAGKDANGIDIITRWTGPLSFAAILDGTSNTLLFGEKHIRPSSLRGRQEDRSVFGGQNNSIRRMVNEATDIDAEHQVKAVTLNLLLDSVAEEDFTDSGIALKPYSPWNLRALPDGADIDVTWRRRWCAGGT